MIPILGFSVNKDEPFTSIYKVSKQLNLSYSLMSKIADIESRFNYKATNSTSSARGLYQIIKSTEKRIRKMYDIKGDIFDPYVNSLIAGYNLKLNIKYLKRKLDRKPTDLECYLSHFFGPVMAFKFINTPDHILGYEAFKKESRYNQRVFFDSQGNPRTIKQIKQYFQDKLDKARVL